jgi:tRNA (guanine9-N1)-methyltransferase
VACAIDLDFDELMVDRDLTSLIQQLMYAYGANRRAARPLDLHLCSVRGRMQAQLGKIEGFANWRATPHDASYLASFARERLVYLSSESDEVLHTLEPGTVYVIGGLVDHNHHKGLTQRRATEAGVRTARLPIDEHMQMSQRRVLAVNHVFEILLQYAQCHDWKQAFLHAMPQRRAAEARTDETES